MEPEAKDDRAAAKGTGPGVVGPGDGSESQKGAFMGTETQRGFFCLVLNVYEIRDCLIPPISFPLAKKHLCLTCVLWNVKKCGSHWLNKELNGQ